MVSLLRALAVAVALSWSSLAAAAAPTLVVENGRLMGAKGVILDGKSYDVEFKDGSCLSLFNNCAPGSFQFNVSSVYDYDSSLASLASLALIESVIVDGPAGNFRSNAGLVNGCTPGEPFCGVWIPFRRTSWDSVFMWYSYFNYPSVGETRQGFGASGLDNGTSNDRFQTNSVWLPSPVTAVSEPESYAMLIAGLGLVGFVARRRQHKVKNPDSTDPGTAVQQGASGDMTLYR